MSRRPRACSVRTPLCSLLLVVGLVGHALAYEDVRPASPRDGEPVSEELHFFLEASGEPEPEEFFLIEVARDDEFEDVVQSFDSRENKQGWAFGSLRGLDDVPERYRPVGYEGIHLRTRRKLPDGEYFWRVSRALGGGAWEPLGGVETFIVDTTPPEPVKTLRVSRGPGGTIELSWDGISFDAEGFPERVAGFRVYHYTKALRMYRPMTRNVLGETENYSMQIAEESVGGHRIVFFRVQAVDEVGNEEGRRRPKPFGEIETNRSINADLLTDPEHLRRLAAEEPE